MPSDEDFWLASNLSHSGSCSRQAHQLNTINLSGRIPFLKIPSFPTTKRLMKSGPVLAFPQLIIIILFSNPIPSNEDEKAFVLSDE